MVDWKVIASNKKEAVYNKIPKEWLIEDRSFVDSAVSTAVNTKKYLDRVLPQHVKDIISKPVSELQKLISSGNLTAVETVTAYCHAAALATQLTNCCSEIFFDRALARAEGLDEYYQKHHKTVGPLHGIPISLKDQINLEGLDSAVGYVSQVNHPKSKDEVSVIATVLEQAGAVFYVKTTTSTAMISDDTYSNIYGQSVNANNSLLSTGGSSGGEGALIAAKGSLIGLSTDIGGSIRTPAAFNGIFGLRPTTSRLPYAKITNSMAHQPVVLSVVGPSARFIDDIKILVKVILDSSPWLLDPRTPRIPWTPYIVPEKLTVGVLYNGGITPHPPVARALNIVVQKLKEQGHQVIQWEPPLKHTEIRDRLNDIFAADAYTEIRNECAKSGEPISKQMMGVQDYKGAELSASEHWEQARLKYEAQMAYDRYWLNTKTQTATGRAVDCWISPVWESVAIKAGEVRPFQGAYTFPINYLDYPATVIPVSKVDKSIDKVPHGFTPLDSEDAESIATYDPELVDGMPVCLQVVAQRYEEEKCLELADYIYKCIR